MQQQTARLWISACLSFVERKYSIRFGKKSRLRKEQISEIRVKLTILNWEEQIMFESSNYFLGRSKNISVKYIYEA
jgi:hypothetical protein